MALDEALKVLVLLHRVGMSREEERDEPERGEGRARDKGGRRANLLPQKAAIRLASSRATPLAKLNTPKTVPRRDCGASSATRAESNPWVMPMCKPHSATDSQMAAGEFFGLSYAEYPGEPDQRHPPRRARCRFGTRGTRRTRRRAHLARSVRAARGAGHCGAVIVPAWDGERVVSSDQVLEVRNVDSRSHVARKTSSRTLRGLDRSRPTFMMSGQSPRRLHAYGAVNAVEQGRWTFHSVHVEARLTH